MNRPDCCSYPCCWPLLWSGVGQAKPRLVVYTYDSFVSWGPANRLRTALNRWHVDVPRLRRLRDAAA